MNFPQAKFFLLLLFVFGMLSIGVSQDSEDFELTYKVNRVYPSLTITKTMFDEAETLIDLNKNFEREWVKEYQSVDITTIHNGAKRKVSSNNDVLTLQQIENIRTADVGEPVVVLVKYTPKNNLPYKDVKEMDFAFTIDPEVGAKFIGGEQKLEQYLKANAVDKIADTSFEIYNVKAVNFTVDEEGNVIDAHVFESNIFDSSNEEADAILLETVCNMPKWKPAKYADGTKVKQQFVLTAGDMRSCTINLLNIRPF